MNSRLRSLFIGNSFFIFGGSLLVPVYALFADDIGASIQMMGLLFAAKFVANAFADLAVMRMGDHMGRTVMVYQASMIIRALAWIYIGFEPSLISLLLVQVVTGLAEGFGTPAFSMLMANNLDKGKHMQQWAMWDLIKNPVIAVASIAGGYIVTQLGFSSMFFIMGGLALVGGLWPVSSRGAKRRKAKQAVRASYNYLFARG
jgi:MFS family permease